jgi:hypothetical protein
MRRWPPKRAMAVLRTSTARSKRKKQAERRATTKVYKQKGDQVAKGLAEVLYNPLHQLDPIPSSSGICWIEVDSAFQLCGISGFSLTYTRFELILQHLPNEPLWSLMSDDIYCHKERVPFHSPAYRQRRASLPQVPLHDWPCLH